MNNPDQKNQEKLIEGYIKGNAREFFLITHWIEQVVKNYQWGLENFNEDIVQDVRLKIYLNLKENKFQRNSKLKTYVYRISKYTCIDFLRKTYPSDKENFEQREIIDEDNALDSLINKEKERVLELVLNELASMCREILQMVFIEKLTYNAISSIFNIAEGTVKSRVSRCIKKAVEIKDKYWNDSKKSTTVK